MKASRNFLVLTVVSLFGFGVIGCGSGFEAGNKSLGSGGLDTEAELELEKLDVELEEFEFALEDVQSEINRLSFTLILNNASGSSSSQNKTGEMQSQGLKKVIDKVFDRLIGSLEKVQSRADELRVKLELYRQMLDPNDEINIPTLDKIEKYIDYLKDLRAKIEAEIDRVIGIVDSKLADVDRKVMEMDPKNPLSWVVAILWQDVRGKVMKYRGRLVERIRGE